MGKREGGGGGGLTSYKHILFKRNLPFSQIVWDQELWAPGGIMLWNTKTEIGVQQYDYEICR